MLDRESTSRLRHMRMQSLTSKDPGLLALTIDELRRLGDDTRQMADACGPFDFAYEHLLTTATNFHKLAFLKACELHQIDRVWEVALERFVPSLGSDLLSLTAERALDLAEETELKAQALGLLTNEGRAMTHRVNQYVELAGVLEGRELALAA